MFFIINLIELLTLVSLVCWKLQLIFSIVPNAISYILIWILFHNSQYNIPLKIWKGRDLDIRNTLIICNDLNIFFHVRKVNNYVKDIRILSTIMYFRKWQLFVDALLMDYRCYKIFLCHAIWSTHIRYSKYLKL